MCDVDAPGKFDLLLQTAQQVHSNALREIDAKHGRHHDLTRYDMQETFRAEALKLGIENKTKDMGFVVTKCLSLSGYGS